MKTMKTFLVLVLAFLFSFSLTAQENKKEARLLKKEVKIQKELQKVNKDKTYDFQNQRFEHQRAVRQMEGRRGHMRMEGKRGHMRMEGKSGHMRMEGRRGQMQRQMNPEHLKFRLEIQKSLEDGTLTPEQAREKMEIFRKEMIEKRLENKDSTNHFRGQRFHMNNKVNKEVEKQEGEKQESKVETIYWSKENMYDLPMNEFEKYVRYKEDSPIIEDWMMDDEYFE